MKTKATRDHDSHNQERLIAAEIITRLFYAGEIDQLRLLEIQVKRAVEMMKEAGTKPSF